MRNRFYDPQLMQVGQTVELGGQEFHHAIRVHRSCVGEEVELFDGRGNAFRGRIADVTKDSARIELIEAVPSREPALQITLGLALIQPEKFELVLQKGTELGVRRFVPLITERIEIRPERVLQKQERWQKLVLEAAKQSGRAFIPEVESPLDFATAARSDGLRIVFDAESEPTALTQTPDAVTLLIGPEGGWSDSELALAKAAGCSLKQIGPRRLRSETAAIAAVTVALMLFGELRP